MLESELMGTTSVVLSGIQIILSLLLVTTVLFQQSDAGLGSAFGGDGGEGQSGHKRRGGEKIIFQSTIVLAVLLAASVVASLAL